MALTGTSTSIALMTLGVSASASLGTTPVSASGVALAVPLIVLRVTASGEGHAPGWTSAYGDWGGETGRGRWRPDAMFDVVPVGTPVSPVVPGTGQGPGFH